jgi:hypothetical protein
MVRYVAVILKFELEHDPRDLIRMFLPDAAAI